jgi:hypothetical protein
VFHIYIFFVKVALWNEVDGQTKLITAANFCQNGKARGNACMNPVLGTVFKTGREAPALKLQLENLQFLQKCSYGCP